MVSLGKGGPGMFSPILNLLISHEKSKLQPLISAAGFSLRWSISYVFERMPSADTVLET